jgi:hypothetical protein
VYLAEPWIRRLDFVHTVRDPNSWLYACDDAEQIVGRRDDDVPSYLFGQHPFLREHAERRRVPLLGALGGPDTTNEPNGDSYLIVTTTIEDPEYLAHQSTPPPQGAQVVQADGKFIIPGLWDSQLNFYS